MRALPAHVAVAVEADVEARHRIRLGGLEGIAEEAVVLIQPPPVLSVQPPPSSLERASRYRTGLPWARAYSISLRVLSPM